MPNDALCLTEGHDGMTMINRRTLVGTTVAFVAALVGIGTPALAGKTLTIDEAIGTLDVEALTDLFLSSMWQGFDDPMSYFGYFWHGRQVVFAGAAVRSGMAEAAMCGRRMTLADLKACGAFESMSSALTDARAPAEVAKWCGKWFALAPNGGPGMSREDYHGYFHSAVKAGLEPLDWGDAITARQIVAGNVDWQRLNDRRKATNAVAAQMVVASWSRRLA